MRLMLWFLALPFRLIRRFATFFAVLALVASLAFNVATLTVASVYAAVTTGLNAVGVTTVAAREAGAKLASQRKVTQSIVRKSSQKVTRRAQRGAARNIASVGGEAIPVIGIAVIAGALTLEVRDACDTAADMAGLEAALAAEGSEEELEAVRAQAVASFDCASLIPEYDDLPGTDDIWVSMKSAPSAAYDKAKAAGISVTEYDWTGAAGSVVTTVIDWVGSFFEAGDPVPDDPTFAPSAEQ
ncbi:hypothetical protein R5H30_21175 [Sulfitobacter sp. D35]|uniref:hypothetical protein n=1 Tax=Sulfitobacter sp. D35 TaxID=3083252 RepID=UPI00296FDDFE|nr:hypothetical protein [Sulfitobacter sp. D35]MDW4500514.1 hypothetical protein [Sulfitobacter sp. D35]